METVVFRNNHQPAFEQDELIQESSSEKAFIQANTVESSFEELKEQHIIPVFIKDNEPVISHTDFIESTAEIVAEVFQGEKILKPAVRLSHPIKGRIPEAKDKPASALLEHEKTLYYERMAFVIELPGITDMVGGNSLSLTVGGVKAYNLDNLYNKKGTDEHFKIFIGFKNSVCTNLCVWTDGFMNDLKVRSIGQLRGAILSLIQGYNQSLHLYHLKKLPEYSITEQQFALLMGRCRMYQHVPLPVKRDIPSLAFGDSQLGAVVKDYYRDESFCRGDGGAINLWKLYNLFTGVNKSTYIDQFLDRSNNAYTFIEQLRWGLDGKNTNWYLS